MKIIIKEQNIQCLSDNNQNVLDLKIGIKEISHTGTTLVDHIVLDILNHIKKDETVFVFSDGSLEAKMIGRKIEDKIKKEVIYHQIENKNI